MKKCLLFVGILLLSSFCISEPAHAADYKVRTINSFETDANETTEYGNWTSHTNIIGTGSGYVMRVNNPVYHGSYSAVVYAYADIGLTNWAWSWLNFTSNSSLGTAMFDKVSICYLNAYSYSGALYFEQWNGPVACSESRLTYQLPTAYTWTQILILPDWNVTATHFTVSVEGGVQGQGSSSRSVAFNVDLFTAESAKTSVRIRYWNLYTGLGYYAEKLLARYYSLVDGWTDVWQNEFDAYKGDEVGLQVTDIFGRNVWTGTVVVDTDPVYVDILVPIVTVYIPKPDWYNDSVPMEWRITCLPYGPDGLAGIEIPATGFEFEVLAGWYSISWLANHYVQAGNQTVYIDGNITERRSFTLSNITIPINPDYEIEVKGKSSIFDLSKWHDLVQIAAALYDDFRVKAIGMGLLVLSILVLMWRAKQLAEQRARGVRR